MSTFQADHSRGCGLDRAIVPKGFFEGKLVEAPMLTLVTDSGMGRLSI